MPNPEDRQLVFQESSVLPQLSFTHLQNWIDKQRDKGPESLETDESYQGNLSIRGLVVVQTKELSRKKDGHRIVLSFFLFGLFNNTKRLSFSKLSSNQKDKNEPSSVNNNNNNQDNHTKPDDTVLIRIREQNSGLPSPASSGQQTPGQQGDQLQRSRLRSIVTLSSSSVRTHSIVAHPDPIRIALQSDSDDGQKDNQQETVKVEITPVPSPPIQQPLSTEISSALSRSLSSTRSIKFSRTPTPTSTHANPIKKWLVSKYPSNPSTTTTATHHQDSLQSPARQPVKLSKKQKNPTRPQSPSNDHHHRPDVLMKTRSDSIVQLDRAHFLNVPKILTSCSDEQQHQLGYPIQEEVLTHQNSPSTTHHNQIHYSPHRPDLVYRPLPPLPQDARSSFDFNHHDGSPIGQID
ncbi:hypothetical protein PSHT_15573, partial [Puccinia striiformis]